MSAVPISSLTFTETEKKYYVSEFDRTTKAEKKPITERVNATQRMTGVMAIQVFKKTKLPDQALKAIWDLAAEGQSFLMLQNFLAAMRMCSILKQKKELSWTNICACTFHPAQPALGKPDKPKKPSAEQSLPTMSEIAAEEEAKLTTTISTDEEQKRPAVEVKKTVDLGAVAGLIGEGIVEDCVEIAVAEVSRYVVREAAEEAERERNAVQFADISLEESQKQPNNPQQESPSEMIDTSVPSAEDIEIPPVSSVHAFIKESLSDTKPSDPPSDIQPLSPVSTIPIPEPAIEPQAAAVEVKKAEETAVEAIDPPIRKCSEPLPSLVERKSSASEFEEVKLDKPKAVDSPLLKPAQISVSEVSFHRSNFTREEAKSNEPVVVPQPVQEPRSIVISSPKLPPKTAGKTLDLRPPQLFAMSSSGMSEVEDVDIAPAAQPPPQLHPAPLPVTTKPKEPAHVPQVEVMNPRTVSAGWFSQGYTLYSIRTTFNPTHITEVNRRFRDIDWVHNQLCAQYKGASIPPRPDKQVFGTQSSKFIEERRAQIEKYLNMVVENEALRRSEVVKVFLTCPLENFEEGKARAEKEAENWGYSGVEDVMDHLVAKIHSKINSTLISSYAHQNTEIVRLEAQLTHLLYPTAVLSNAFTTWVRGDRKIFEKHLAVDVPMHDQFNNAMGEFAGVEERALREMEKRAMDYREEVMRIEGLNNAISAYRETCDFISQQEALIRRKEGKLRASITEEQGARYQAEIDSATEEHKRLIAQLDDIITNVSRDSQNFVKSREKHLLDTVRAVVDEQCQRWARSSDFWRRKQSSL